MPPRLQESRKSYSIISALLRWLLLGGRERAVLLPFLHLLEALFVEEMATICNVESPLLKGEIGLCLWHNAV